MHSSSKPFRGLDLSIKQCVSQKANLLMNPRSITDPVQKDSNQGQRQNFVSDGHENLFMQAQHMQQNSLQTENIEYINHMLRSRTPGLERPQEALEFADQVRSFH